MYCSLPGSSVNGILQGYWSGLPCPPPGIFPTQGSNPHLLHWQVGSLPTEPPGKPKVDRLIELREAKERRGSMQGSEV